MKKFIQSIRITIAFCVFLSVCYVLVLWIFGQCFGPGKGSVQTVSSDGKVVGVAQVGQLFTKDIYFWGRPSKAGRGYDASASAGSNQGPANASYLKEVEVRIDTFMAHHPYLDKSEVPAEMVTASASGLDPDITLQSAYVQIKRVAQARHMREQDVREIVDKTFQKPFLGVLGTAKVNVLQLNIALDQAQSIHK